MIKTTMFRVSKYLLVGFFAGVANLSNADDVLLDVLELAGQSKDDVATMIGTPLQCGSSKYGEKCAYEIAETVIVFIDGKADWITIEGIDAAPFSDDTIELLGFESAAPSFENSFTKRWDSIEGFLSVSLFKGATNSDYAYIKSYTE